MRVSIVCPPVQTSAPRFILHHGPDCCAYSRRRQRGGLSWVTAMDRVCRAAMMRCVDIEQRKPMKHSHVVLAFAAVAFLSTASSAQQRPNISGLWTRGGAANTLYRAPASGP